MEPCSLLISPLCVHHRHAFSRKLGCVTLGRGLPRVALHWVSSDVTCQGGFCLRGSTLGDEW